MYTQPLGSPLENPNTASSLRGQATGKTNALEQSLRPISKNVFSVLLTMMYILQDGQLWNFLARAD